MRTFFITFSAIALLSSCSNKQPIVYENDTEPHEWVGMASIKENPNAHSGKSVCVIDSLNPYSIAFSKKIEEISPEKIKSVTFTYWIYLKSSTAKANTVFSIDFEGKNINWLGLPIQEKVKEYNKWVQISETFNFPDNVEPKNILSLYVWNATKEEVLLDDFHVEFN